VTSPLRPPTKKPIRIPHDQTVSAMPRLVRTSWAAGFPAPGEWAPRCNLTGGLLRRVVLTKASGKLHNRIGIAARARRGAFGDGRARQSCVLNKGVDPR
jgi:hypothetical protein